MVIQPCYLLGPEWRVFNILVMFESCMKLGVNPNERIHFLKTISNVIKVLKGID